MALGVRLHAVRAAEPPKAVAVLSKALAAGTAMSAIHHLDGLCIAQHNAIIQQALAVCQ